MNNSYIKRILMLYRVIPTALTLGNVLCGFTAILNTLLIYKIPADQLNAEVPIVLTKSAWLIAGAMIFDMLDGWTARKLKATSAMGMQMDSLADMVTFGLAPAVLVASLAHVMDHRFISASFYWVWFLCAIYVCCVALRLALYNVIAATEGCSDKFYGLPSPGGAAAVASLIFVYRFGAQGGELRGIVKKLVGQGDLHTFITDGTFGEYVLNILPIYAALLGFLMVSKVPYHHFGKWLGDKKRYKLKILTIIIFFIAFAYHPLVVATVSINVYVLWAPLQYVLNFQKRRQETKATRPAEQH